MNQNSNRLIQNRWSILKYFENLLVFIVETRLLSWEMKSSKRSSVKKRRKQKTKRLVCHTFSNVLSLRLASNDDHLSTRLLPGCIEGFITVWRGRRIWSGGRTNLRVNFYISLWDFYDAQSGFRFGKFIGVKIWSSRQFLIFISTNDLWKRLPERLESPQVVDSRSLDNYLSSSTNSPNNPGTYTRTCNPYLAASQVHPISNYDPVKSFGAFLPKVTQS